MLGYNTSMLRVLIFSAACLVVFVGLATAMPILEDGISVGQFAASAYPSEEIHIAPSCIISAHPQVISEGDTASIAWSSRHASEAEISPRVGTVPLEGGMFLEPHYSEVYTLTARSDLGEVATCSTYVTVE